MNKITDLWINNDPRGKLLIALLCSISAILLNTVSSLLLICLLALSFCCLSRVSPGYIIKRGLLVNIFLAFVWLTLPWRLEISPWSLTFNSHGIWLAFIITLKCNAIFLAWMGLLWHTNLNDMLRALAHFHLSPKLLALLFLFCRFSQIIQHEYFMLRRAMRARGFKPGLDIHTLKSYARLLSTMLLRGFDRAEQVYRAMLCRGFQGKFYFATDNLVWHRHNSLVFAAALGAMVLVALPCCYERMF